MAQYGCGKAVLSIQSGDSRGPKSKASHDVDQIGQGGTVVPTRSAPGSLGPAGQNCLTQPCSPSIVSTIVAGKTVNAEGFLMMRMSCMHEILLPCEDLEPSMADRRTDNRKGEGRSERTETLETLNRRG